jgi:RimJ/RimL family protein N-acetyltransferase
MLKVFHSMAELPFGKLMDIYAQSNRERGEQWLQESPDRQIALAEQEFYAYLRQCFYARPGSQYFIWEDEGKTVCAVRCESYADGVLLTALETAPGYRGKGYATKLLNAVLTHLEHGKVYVHIHHNNQPSLAVHRRCGFVRVKSGARMLDGSYSREHETYMTEL